jgi:hypothetical protein
VETTLQPGLGARTHSAHPRGARTRTALAGAAAVALAALLALAAYAAITSIHHTTTKKDVITSTPVAAATRTHAATRSHAVPAHAATAVHVTSRSNEIVYTTANDGSYGALCGNDGLSVGPNTTCAFAENVRSAYESDGPGIVDAYSPVTGLTYTMSCSAGPSVVCTGGNGASVYFASSVSVSPAPGYDSGTTACGDGVWVGPNASCAFAANVQLAYDANGSGTVIAYSPVTDTTYLMTCSGDSPVVCTGGNDATVYLW